MYAARFPTLPRRAWPYAPISTACAQVRTHTAGKRTRQPVHPGTARMRDTAVRSMNACCRFSSLRTRTATSSNNMAGQPLGALSTSLRQTVRVPPARVRLRRRRMATLPKLVAATATSTHLCRSAAPIWLSPHPAIAGSLQRTAPGTLGHLCRLPRRSTRRQ